MHVKCASIVFMVRLLCPTTPEHKHIGECRADFHPTSIRKIATARVCVGLHPHFPGNRVDDRLFFFYFCSKKYYTRNLPTVVSACSQFLRCRKYFSLTHMHTHIWVSVGRYCAFTVACVSAALCRNLEIQGMSSVAAQRRLLI